MISNIIFVQSDKNFKKKEKAEIKNIIKTTANQAAKILRLDKNKKINFSVYFAKINNIGGGTYAKDFIQLVIPIKKRITKDVPNSIIEGFSRGKPCIISSAVDYSKIVRKGGFGIIINSFTEIPIIKITEKEYKKMSLNVFSNSLHHTSKKYEELILRQYENSEIRR